jgi:hypothetical protein
MAIYVLDAQSPSLRVRRVVQFKDADVVTFQWVNDERLVFSVTDLKLESGPAAEQGGGLYAANVDGSGFRQLIERSWREPVSDGQQPDSLPANHFLMFVPVSSKPEGGAQPTPSRRWL